MQFSILGPLAVHVDGADVAPTAGKPRALLVRLLIAGGRPVPAERLVDDLWEGDPPRSAAQTLQTYILQLRKAVGADRLVTDGGGYRLVVHDGEVDADTFERAIATAREALARGQAWEAVGAFERALRLWRGTALVDAGGAAWARGEAARLDELRLVAQEFLLQAQLAAGQDAEVVAAAESAVTEHPLRERLWAHLITALYRQGRQADALRAFHRLRRHLADELGIDPSRELRELERAVLEQDQRLGTPPPTGEPGEQPRPALPSGTVTFLLTDVVGSTRLWDTFPRRMPGALALHDEATREAVDSHGGVVLKARGEGDSVFAVFRRATDAVGAAAGAQRALASLEWPEGCALTVRMAIHTGEALERDGDYYGPTVNRAARLRSLAKGGQVLVSHATAELIVDHLPADVRLVELGPQQLRDLERPETVYLLVDADAGVDVAAPTEAAPAPLDPPPLPSTLAGAGPFVGREPELARLDAEWQLVQHGTPRVAMVGGEPGVGKTRLAAEVARRVHEGGGVVLYGRCDEDLGAPYQPFAEALRVVLPALDTRTLRAVRGVEELVRLVPELADAVPDLPPPTRGDPDTERYALFDAVARVLVTVSKERPTLVVLDDLHWAAKPTLLMLRHVLRFGEGARLQLLGTYRTTDLDPNHPLSGTLADLHRDGTIERVVLSGLGEGDVNALLEATGHDDDQLAKTLSTVTSGNPFFLIEVLRHVEETGGRWDPNTLPQGVREAVGRRLARLTDPTREALLAAAVAGARFSLDLVEQVLDRDLVDAVAEACDAGLLIEEAGGHLRFNHALVRQSLLHGVASVKRVRLHQRIAETLEAAGGDSEERLADLAHHYFESAWAGNAAKAVQYCRRAADQAMARLAYEGAAELYERAVQALDVDDEAGTVADRAELLLARCEAHLAAGDAAGATAAVDDLEHVAGDSRALAAWVVCFRAQLAVLTHPDQLDEMEHRVASAADEFASLGDAAGEAVAHNTRASCLARLGRFAECELALDRALTAARRSTEAATAADHRRVNAVLAGAPSAALWGPSPVARAGGRCLDVIRLLRITTGSPAVEATSVRCQAMLEAFRGREQAARRMLDSARRSLAELGLRHALLEVDLYEGMVDLLADDVEAALGHLRRAYEGMSRMGLDADAAEAAALLARACLLSGQEEEADRFCIESERLGGQDLRASIAWRTVRAELLARQGDHELAREVAEAAVALAEPTDALVDQGDAHLALAVVLHAIDDHGAAAAAANEAVARYERKGATALADRARRLVRARAAPATATKRDEEPSWLASAAFKTLFRRYNEVFATRSWDRLAELMEPDVHLDNRRRLTLEASFRGVDAYADFMRSVTEHVGYRATIDQRVATRGPLLALVHTTPVGIHDQEDTPGEEVFRVMHLAETGRLASDVIFDIEDLDAAYAELDARYVRGEAALHADVFRTVADAIDAYNRRDPAHAALSPDLEAVDHRPAAVVARGGEALIADFEAAIAQLPDSTLRLAAVHVLGDGGAVVTTVLQGTTPAGATVERVFHAVHVVEDASIARVEIFPESALDAALARFAELTMPPSVRDVRPNRAVRVFTAMHDAYFRQDWATVASLLGEDSAYDDRRPGFQFAFAGPARWIDNFQAMAAMGVDRLDRVVVATRGDLLALCLVRGGGTDEDAAAPDVEVLNLMVIGEDGRVRETLVFEPSDREAAFAAMDERYLGGEAAPYADAFQLYLDYFEARVRDPERSLELVADDLTFVDHRPIGLGSIQGKEEYARVLQPEAVSRFDVLTVEAIGEGTVLALVEAPGVASDGATVEWRLHALCAFRDGLLVRAEGFGPEDGAAARAAFEELCPDAAGAEIAGNTATATWARFHDACAQQDWATLDAVLADDVVSDDRRSGVLLRVTGRSAVAEVARSMTLVGAYSRDSAVLATRGDRVALIHTRVGGGERGTGWVAESLDLVEVDADGRHLAGIHFDVADLDAAIAELDARYLAGEGAPYASTVGPVLECIRALATDFDRFVALHAPDVVVFDRRPAAYGVMEGRDAFLDTVEPSWPTETRVLSIEVADDGVVLTRIRATGRSEHGADLEWLFCILHVVENGLITRLEFFETEDVAEATARFEELRRRSELPVVLDNTAARVFRRYETACGEQDWALVESLVADDVVADDRRSGSHTRFEGRAALVEAMRGVVAIGTTRFHHTTVATRGDRVALISVLGAGADTGPGAPEMEVLDVVEVDTEGRVAVLVALDADDVDAAIAELDARYLAGEGAPWAETLTPVLEGVQARTRDWDRWVDLLADDVSFVDHRPAGFGVIDGREAVVDALDPQWDERGHTVALEAVDHGVVLTLDRALGTSEDGVQVEWLIFVLYAVENGQLRRFEVFSADDAGAARSRFEALRARPELPAIGGNGATAAWGRHQDACEREDWSAVEALLVEDAVLDDRRAGVHVTAQGRGSVVHVCRTLVAMLAVRFERTTMATRGSRLALIRTRGSGTDRQPGAPALEVLDVVEVDAEGRIVRAVIFDIGDADAAFAELDARYLAGDGGPWAETLAPVLEVVHARTRDQARWVDLLADDISYVDNRVVPAALGVVEGRDAVVGALGPVWNERGRTVAVEAVDHGVVLTLDRTTGAGEEGSQAEWLMYVLRLVERGQLRRVEVFSGDDSSAARARFEELRARAAVPPIAGNVATDSWGRYHDACAGRDWATVQALLAEEVVLDDHRAHLYLQGAAAVAGVARSLAAVGTVRFERTTLATRGSRVALMRTRGSGTDREPGAPALEVLDVVEVDAEGRIVRSVHFDVDDVDAAFAELDDRYLAGEGARLAATVAPFLEGVRSRARDWATFASLMSQRIVFVDHRRAGFGVIEGRETFLDLMALPDWPAEHRVLEVEAVDEGAVLALFAARATADDGVQAEWLFHMLNVIEDGLTTRTELFDHDDLPGALARFEELRLRPGASPISDNSASAVFRRYQTACTAQDWAAVERMLAADVVTHDRRLGSRMRYEGRELQLQAMRAVTAIGVTTLDHTTVATRGARLALVRVRGSGADPSPGAPEGEVLDLVETDASGRVIAVDTFDPEDLDAAFAELDDRYLAGEGAPHSATMSVFLEGIRTRARDWDAFVTLTAEHIVLVDHRRAGFGVIEGRGLFFDVVVRPEWPAENRVLDVEAADDGVVLGLLEARGTSNDGVEAEWLFHMLAVVDGGLYQRFELFDHDDLAGALARFEELRRRPAGGVIPPNTAAQAIARFLHACGRREWDLAKEMGSPDVRMDDLRTGVQLRGVDRQGWVETHRVGIEMGVTRIEPTTVATRGDRLVLSRLWCGTDAVGGAPVVEMLQIIQTDERGLIVASIGLDLDDVDAAFAELDRRYLAGEGAPYESTLRVPLEAVDAAGSDKARWQDLMADTISMIDHRRVGFGRIEGRGAVVDFLSEDGVRRRRVVAVERLEDGLALVLIRISGESAAGAPVEWLVHQLTLVEGGRCSALELFDIDDFDAALARFDDLRRPQVEAIRPNLATQSSAMLYEAAEHGDWGTAEAILAEDVDGPDRRSGIPFGTVGRDAMLEGFRFGFERGATRWDSTTVATRGERLALSKVVIGGDPQRGAPTVEMLQIIETDDTGRITTAGAFDVNDLDGAFAELDRRYLAGEGAPHASTLRVMLDGVPAVAADRQRWETLLAPDVLLVDHRRAAFGTVEGKASVLELVRLRWATRADVAAIEKVDDGLVLALDTIVAEDADGGRAEWLLHNLAVIRDGLVTRTDLFDLDDLDGALVTFEELRRPRAPENLAAASVTRLANACLRRDWEAVAALLAADVVDHGPRLGVRHTSVGRDAAVAAWRFGADQGVTHYDVTTVASRGDRLVLTRVWCGSDGIETPFVEFLWVAETDVDGLIANTRTFDVDDLDAAYAELDARYLTGEGAPHAGTLAPVLATSAAWRDGTWPDLLADDAVLEDHRPASFGVVTGRGAITRLLHRRWTSRAEILAVDDVDGGVALLRTRSRAESPDGAAVEWLAHHVFAVESGLVTKIEVFDRDDDTARRRFEELRAAAAAAVVEPNTAARVHEWLLRCMLERRWSDLEDVFAENVVIEDRRPLLQVTVRGRDEAMAHQRTVAALGFDVGTTTLLATRGDRLVLSRVIARTRDVDPGAVENVLLVVSEVDNSSRLVGSVLFDVDDLEAAHAELDARYLAGEGAPYASTLGPVLGTAPGWRTGQWLDAMADDVVFVDHRPASFPPVEGREALARLLSSEWATRAEAVDVPAVDDGVVLVRSLIGGRSPDGAAVEWLVREIHVVADGLISRLELFADDDVDAANRRFEELRSAASAAVVEPNTAARVLARSYRCVLEQRWDELDALTADDIVYEDRRPLLQMTARGRREFVESCRIAVDVGFSQGSIELIATRGDRLALARIVGSAGDSEPGGVENIMLGVVEVDESGRSVASVLLDAGDLDAGYAELDARYLAGEGALHAATLVLLLATAEGWRTGRWVDAVADDVVFVDHRAAAFGVIEGRESLARLLRGEWTTRVDAVAVDAIDRGVVLFRTMSTGVTPDGAAVEWFVRQIHVVEDGLVSRVEMFEGDDEDGANRRFEELRPEASAPVVEPNTAARVLARHYRCLLEQRWPEFEALTAEDVVYEDRRAGLRVMLRGHRDFVESCRIAAEVGFSEGSMELIATRGDRLALSRITGRTGDGEPGGVETVSLGVNEVDGSGRVVASVIFDAGDLDAAYAELDARYLAGEGAPYATTLALVLHFPARWQDDPESWTKALASDVVLHDHRPASLGLAEGREAVSRALRPASMTRLEYLAVEAVDHAAGMLKLRVRAEAPDGAGAEWLLHHIFVVEDGFVARIELFEHEQRDAARRRYEELCLAAEARRTTDNTAARVLRRLFQHVVHQQWREMEEIVADDVAYEDRRAVIRVSLRGRAAYLEQGRLTVSVGIRGIDQEVVATRGERLVLSRLTATTAEPRDGGPEIVSLFVNEIDASHRVVGAVGFEADDLDAAFAELDARYLAGEAAPAADTWTAIVEAYRRFNEGQGELRWPAAPVEVTAFADIPDVNARVTGVHRLVDGAALLTVRASAPGLDAWEWLVVLTVSDGRISALETYSVDDLAAALHRFDELASAG